MSGQTPAHRFAPTVRSGDSHVIGEDGEIRNVDKPAATATQPDGDAVSKPPRPSRK